MPQAKASKDDFKKKMPVEKARKDDVKSKKAAYKTSKSNYESSDDEERRRSYSECSYDV